jgi:hypothetical protein
VLGATFASMFPDRVGRVVLDGVVDAEHWVTPIWEGAIRDADAIWNSFAKYCHAGKEECALYRPGDEIDDVQNRLETAIEVFKANPISSFDPITKTPVVIHYNDIRPLLFGSLYFPVLIWKPIAMIMDLFYRGYGEIIGPALVIYPDLKPVCAPPLPIWQYPDEAQQAVMCSDKKYPVCHVASIHHRLLITKPVE